MAEYQDAVAYNPVPDLLLSPDENSGEEEEQQEKQRLEERPFKIEYVPLAAGAYTELPLVMVPTLEFGGNYFSQMLPFADSRVLYRALLQRCHRDEQLHQRRFVFRAPNGQPARDVKLPLGISLDDYEASPLSDPYGPPKRWAVAIDCEMVGVAPTPQELAVYKPQTDGTRRGTPATPAQASQGQRRGTPLGSPAQLGRGQGHATATTATTDKPTAPKEMRKPPKTPVERSELAQLCAVDVLTGEVLVNVLVQPRQRVVNWRTRYSGITPQALREAKARGDCVTGWEEARSLLLEYVDASTILVGHSLDNDLPMLRLAHTRIVDTAMQTAEAVYGAVDRFPRIWRLRDLLSDLTGLAVQNHGRRGHSCLEDALGTRELALWCLRFPRRLEAWGREQRDLLEAQAVERETQRLEREKQAADQKKKEAAEDKEKVAAAAMRGDDAVQYANDQKKKRLRRKPKPLHAH